MSNVIAETIASSRAQCVASVGFADRPFGFVTITDLENSDNEVFLENDEANNFISKCNDLFDQGDLSMQDCIYFVAYDYLDLFCN